MEADELGLYMFLTCLFAFVVRHPASPFNTCLLALCLGASRWDWEMGATTNAIITLPWGKQIRVSRSLLFAAAEVFVREPV